MLQSLHIRKFAIIDDVTLELGPGLNVLTGETGAGKSIIIQALSLLMGQRGSSDWIRKDEDAAVVTGLFNVSDQKDLIRLLDEWGVPCDDGELLIQRTLSRAGRNQVRLNGAPSTVAMLSELAIPLVDIVSQKEHEQLLQPEVQRDLLDQFGGLQKQRDAYYGSLESLKGLQNKLETLIESDRSNREMAEFLRFQVQEIKEAKLKENEDVELKTEKSRIKNASQLGELFTFGDQMLVSGDDTITGRLAKLEQKIARVSDDDKDLAALGEVLQSVQGQLDEVARVFGNQLEQLSFEPGRLETIESRLAEIDRLKKKYGESVSAILEHAETTAESLNALDNYEDRVAELKAEIAAAEKELKKCESVLIKERRKVAVRLSKAVMQELADLGMEQAEFSVEVSAAEVVFHLVANPGEDSKPLARVASGGEGSRILLAVKKVLVDFADLCTSVYDEVDEGVGGATSSKIGEKLAEIAQKRQVICITHQAQIAAFAAQHFVITKEFASNRTNTKVHYLEPSDREAEIARMLAGKEVTTEATEHARQLLQGCAP